MPNHDPKRIPLAGTVGNDFFVRQLDEYSCGPAALATVSKIYQLGLSYDELRFEADPDPLTGTSCEVMEAITANFFPAESAGENTYQGGVAVACIIQGGEGHYVVLLEKEGDKVLYYDPYEHELVIEKIANIDWHNGDHSNKNWTVNFTPLPKNSFDVWLAYAEPQTAAPKSAPKGPKPPKPPAPKW